jgi:Flp pilus assembly protein TadD
VYLGDHVEVERRYRRAIELAPGYAQARYELARYALVRQDQPTAAAELEAALRHDPDRPDGIHETVMSILMNRGEGDRALRILVTLAKWRPDDSGFRSTQGVVLAQMGREE